MGTLFTENKAGKQLLLLAGHDGKVSTSDYLVRNTFTLHPPITPTPPQKMGTELGDA